LLFDEITDKNKLAPFMAHGVYWKLTVQHSTARIFSTENFFYQITNIT